MNTSEYSDGGENTSSSSDADMPRDDSPALPAIPKAVRLLGPARQLVWVHIITAEVPLTAAELADRTAWSRRHVREAANDLYREGLVERRPDANAPNQYVYRVSCGCCEGE